MCSSDLVITPYRIDIVQGNAVTKEQAELVKPGLSKLQVRDILGHRHQRVYRRGYYPHVGVGLDQIESAHRTGYLRRIAK